MNLLGRRRVLWDYLRGALWVLPSLSIATFLVAGAVLSRVVIDEDSPLWGLVFQGTAEDARQLLIVVSATMITVTGLVFALTIVALQIASGQYSPRLLRNFMRDRGTQLVLSVFVGAFAYSTAGLHTVGVQRAGEQAFVPRLAVSGSLALGLASVGVLVYFIHHLAHSIQIDTIISDIGRETRRVIDDLYPDELGALEPEERCPDLPRGASVVVTDRSGYIQAVEPAALVEAATRHDLVVRLARRVGDHGSDATSCASRVLRVRTEPMRAGTQGVQCGRSGCKQLANSPLTCTNSGVVGDCPVLLLVAWAWRVGGLSVHRRPVASAAAPVFAGCMHYYERYLSSG